jgi:hypothetical protein
MLSLCQALPTDLYSSNALLSHEKSIAIKRKMLFFSSFLVIIIGFLVIAGFLSVEGEGPLFAGYCLL